MYERTNWTGITEALNKIEAGVWTVDGLARFAIDEINTLRDELAFVRVQDNIQAAIDYVAARGGGVVRVGAGSHRIDSELFLKNGVSLEGEGSATILRASVAMHSVLNTASSAASSIRHLRIDCANKAQYGLYSSPVAGSSYGDFAPDPCFRASDLFIDDAQIAGVYLGGQARSTRLEEIRVRRAGGWGFWLRNADSTIVDCEATTTGAWKESPDTDQKPSTGSGFYVGCVNTVIRGCKAWYTRGYGWHIRGSRNRISECESQDTRSHGWKIEYDKNVFTNCVADSSSMYDVGGIVNGADGFYIDGTGNVFVGVLAFDRKPGGKAAQQRYGVNVKQAVLDAGHMLGVHGYDNATKLMNVRP